MIYIIITTSINNKEGVKNNIHRQTRYIECINNLLELINNDSNIKPIIVENNGVRQTYLDDLKCDIYYTNNNMIHYNHKGVNELLDIKEVINQYNIKDEDIIIKLTGRYKLLNLNFINFVKNNINDYDAFVKFYNVCTKQYMFDDCVLGLFAVKCKYLKEFKYNFLKSAECDFADYIRKNVDKNKIKEVHQLDLECCFADDLRILVV
tara:strand:+ start:128 stop:748 length:621 start_codon:yes stop_codon:yes gene_type:complete